MNLLSLVSARIKMASEDVSAQKPRDVCIICCNHFQGHSKATRLDSILMHSREVQICSSVCCWQMKYTLGVVHGFLLHSILRKLVNINATYCKTGQVYAHSPESSYSCDNTTINDEFHCGKTNEASLPVKTEESQSDLEDFDCTVSFQDNVYYDSTEDICEEKSDVLQFPTSQPQKKQRRSSSRKVPSYVHFGTRNALERSSKINKHNQGPSETLAPETDSHVKGNTETQCNMSETCETPLVIDQTKSKAQIKKRTGKKHDHKLKMKQNGNTNLVSEKCADDQHKEKRPKLSQEARRENDTEEETKPSDGETSAMQCDFCSKSFTARRFLQRHLNCFHPREIEISCTVCGSRCKNQKHLSTHMRKEHNAKLSKGEELYHCEQCPKSFNSRRGLALHKEFVHSEENPVNCPLCDLTLKNETYLKRHLKRSHSDCVICHICGAKFKSRLALTSHLSAHKGVKSYFCEVCGMGFVRKTSLQRHMQQHRDTSYTCKSCPASYKTWGSLSLHQLQAHQMGAYFTNRLTTARKLGYPVDMQAIDRHWKSQCVACGQALVAGACADHPTSHALMFKCHLCELTAEHVDDLLAHLKDHDSAVATSSSINVSFDCKVCHKVFPRKLYLKQHLSKQHPGASVASLAPHPITLTFRCQVCGKQFRQKQYLYVHMKQHLQPGTFSCHVCDRKFTYKCNLKSHLSTHSQDKPFQCELCLKVFRRKEVLTSHRLVHSPALSPFKCQLCGKGLSRRQYLKKHYQLLHPEWKESQQQVPST